MNELLNKTISAILPRRKNVAIESTNSSVTACAMKRDWNFGREVVFQIDQQSMQYCVVQRNLTSTTIIDFGKIYRPRTGSALQDHSTFLSEELQHLAKQHKLSGARFGLSVASSDLAVRTLRIPKMSHSEERNAVYFEGDKSIPFALEDAYWAYRRCKHFTTDTSCDTSITLMALLRTNLDDILLFFENNGIKFDFISQDTEALGLSLKALPDFQESRPFGLLNIRPAKTDVSLYDGSCLQFLHHGGIGSLALGQTLQFGSDASSFIPQALSNFAEGVENAIQQALDYYGAQNGIDDLSTFYIYGDFTYSAELIDIMSQRFGITFKRFPVEVFSKYPLMNPELKDILPVALPVVAVATSPFELSDFTPELVHEQRRHKSFVRHSLAAAALTLLTLGLAWSSVWFKNNIAASGFESASETVSRFENSTAYAGYRILKEELMRQERMIKELEHKTSQHYLALVDIAALTPSTIHLDYLQYFPKDAGRNSTLSGMVISRLVAPEVILAEFVTRLGGSPLFTNVQLKSHSKNIDGGTRKVTFSLDLEATL